MAPFTLVLASGALCWAVGNVVWLGSCATTAATPWWFAFLVLTIAGERLELSRFIPTPRAAQRAIFAIVGALLLGAAMSLIDEHNGLALSSLASLSLAVWLLSFDIALRNVRREGLPRFIAVCLLTGYVWLGFAGILGVDGGFELGHAWRDSTLHAVGLGFVFSMVLGHAPIIFPAVARVKIPYHVSFYLPLLALHGTLLLRVVGGVGGDFSVRRIGGLANAYALLAFFVVLLIGILRGKGAVGRVSERQPSWPTRLRLSAQENFDHGQKL